MKNLLITSALLLAVASPTYAQQVERLDLELSPPNINTDRGDGYQYEMRGVVLKKDQTKVGRYLLRVRYNKSDGLIATFAVTIPEYGTIAWESYSFYQRDENGIETSFAYEGRVLKDGQHVLTEYTPMHADKFGGLLSIWFLNN